MSEYLNSYLDEVEITENLSENSIRDMEDDQIYELLQIFNGEVEYRNHRKLLVREMTKRILDCTGVYIDFEEEDGDY
jgi:hypothetical protein